MKNRQIAIIAAIVLAFVAVILVKLYLDQQQKTLQAAAEAKAKEAAAQKQAVVLVAVEDIPAGSIIEAQSVGEQSIPVQYIDPQAVTSFGRIAGLTTAVTIAKGEQITRSKLADTRPKANLANLTPKGKRAVTISVDNVASVAGMVRPGDYVDVIAAVQVPVQSGKGEKLTQTAVVPIFQYVQVLAVGQDISSVPAPATKQGAQAKSATSSSLITLSLNAQEANMLAFVQEQGKIRLVLRAASDSQIETTTPVSWDLLLQYLSPAKKDASRVGEDKTANILGQGASVEIIRGVNKEKIPLAAK